MSLQVPPGQNEDLWIHQFERAQSMTRLTFEDARDQNPLWSPDGKYLYFGSYEGDTNRLLRRRSDGTGNVETILSSPHSSYPADITPEGAELLIGTEGDDRRWDIFELRLEAAGGAAPGEPDLSPVLQTQFAEGGTKLSPDGKWLAYNTDETQPTQVFVRPFPNLDDGRWQVSTDGGINPTWSADGKTIYYRHGQKMMEVSVEPAPEFRAGSPRVLFEADYYYAPDLSVQYDLEYPRRKRFLMMKELPDHHTTHLVYVGHWIRELSRLVPES